MFTLSKLRAFTALVSALLAIAIPLSAYSAPQTVSSGVLSVGSDLTYPPFVYLKDGVPAGFDVEVMQAISKKMGLTVKFVDTRFTSLITGIRANHFDVVASALYVTPERQKILNFVPYIKAGSSLLVLNDASFRPTSEQQLCGKIVGSMQGASWLPKLKALSDGYCMENGLGAIETREFDTDAQVTQALRSRSVDVEFMDNVVAASLLKKFPGNYAVTSTELIYPVLIGIAIRPQNKELFTAVSEAFTQTRKDGTYEQLADAYGMSTVSDAEIESILFAAR